MDRSKNSKATPTKRTANSTFGSQNYKSSTRDTYRNRSLEQEYFDEEDEDDDFDEIYDSEDFY